MKRTLISLSAVAALALGLAPAAGAASYATTPPLSQAAKNAENPQVVVTPGGERIVAWVQNATDGFTGENISVRTAPPGGDFGDTQTFPSPGNFADLKAAVGSDGTVALAWTDANQNSIHVARRAPGESTFTDATPLRATNETSFGVHPIVTGGDVYVSFESFTQAPTNPSSVWVGRLAAGDNAVRLAPGTALGGAVDHAQFNTGQPQVFVESTSLAVAGGEPILAWQRQTFGANNQNGSTRIEVSKRDNAAFRAPSDIVTLGSGSTTPRDVRPLITSGGNHVYVLWPNIGGQVVFQDLGNPGVTIPIPADTVFEGDLHAGVDGSGTLIAAWEGEPTGSNALLIEAAVVPPDAPPPSAVRLTPAGAGRQLDDLAVAPDGSALAIFDHETSGSDTAEQIDGSLRVGGGAFGPVETISGLQDVPRGVEHQAAAAVAPGGRALAVWPAAEHVGTRSQRLHLSERDTTPPAIDSIDAPADAVVGQPAAFAASASDSLSGASVSWDFGDGSGADGASVSHTFGSPGAATVTVTAVDGAGNSTQQTRVVAVAPAPTTTVPEDRVAPTVSGVSLAHKRFRAGGKGTALRLKLSERATLVVTVERARLVRETLVRASAAPGAVSLRISGNALRPGVYTATVSAIDGAGNRSKARHVEFRVVRR